MDPSQSLPLIEFHFSFVGSLTEWMAEEAHTNDHIKTCHQLTPQNIYTQITSRTTTKYITSIPKYKYLQYQYIWTTSHQSTTPHFPALNPSSQTSSSQQAFYHQPQTSAQASQHHQQIQNAIAQPMLSLDQINDLLSTLIGGPSEKIDPSIIQILSRIADEFVEDMAKGAAHLANLRSGRVFQ